MANTHVAPSVVASAEAVRTAAQTIFAKALQLISDQREASDAVTPGRMAAYSAIASLAAAPSAATALPVIEAALTEAVEGKNEGSAKNAAATLKAKLLLCAKPQACKVVPTYVTWLVAAYAEKAGAPAKPTERAEKLMSFWSRAQLAVEKLATLAEEGTTFASVDDIATFAQAKANARLFDADYIAKNMTRMVGTLDEFCKSVPCFEFQPALWDALRTLDRLTSKERVQDAIVLAQKTVAQAIVQTEGKAAPVAPATVATAPVAPAMPDIQAMIAAAVANAVANITAVQNTAPKPAAPRTAREPHANAPKAPVQTNSGDVENLM